MKLLDLLVPVLTVECIKQDLETSKSNQKAIETYFFFFRDDPREFAIKKFKPDREGDTHHYVGISQSACREIAVRFLKKKLCK